MNKPKVTLNRNVLKQAIKKKLIEQIRSFLNSDQWKGETVAWYMPVGWLEPPSRYLYSVYYGNPYEGNYPDIYTVHTIYKDVKGTIDENGKIKINLNYRIEETKGTYREVCNELGGHTWVA